MREVMIGDECCQLHGSLWTLIIYRDEFTRPGDKKRADLISDVFGTMLDAAKAGIDLDRPDDIDLDKVDLVDLFAMFVPLVQAAWAMCKTAHLGGAFPSFSEWVKGHDEADLMAIMGPVMEEAQRAFFRDAATAAQAKAAR